MSNIKVAIVHDWLYGGGAERVVYELHQMFPDAPIYTSYCSNEWRARLDNKVVTGYLQHWPFNKLRKILQIPRIMWFESLDFSGYDLVISSSGNGEAKGVKAGSKFYPGQTHICYCHTPSHFLWRHYDLYMQNFGLGIFNPVARLGLKLLVKPLRKWDLKAAQRPDYFIANSTHIQADIKRYYHRDSTVIFPPVDTSRFELAEHQSATQKRQGFVTVGRLVPQKRTEIIVQACTQLDLPLTVVGNGPELNNLIKLAGPTITFATATSDEQVVRHMQTAQAFLFASEDDFGITPIEAMAAGTPVIAYRAGGALDYVKPGVTGDFFDKQTAESLSKTLKNFKPSKYDSRAIQKAANRFSADNFIAAINKVLK